MKVNIVGPVVANAPFGTETAFMKGFQRLHYDVKFVDPNFRDKVDFFTDPDFTLVFKTGHWFNETLPSISGPKIVYQPDDMRFPHIQRLMREMRRYCDYALTFDDYGAIVLSRPDYVYLKTQPLLLTADPELYRPLNYERDLDVVFMGSVGDRVAHASRMRMIKLLISAGIKVTWGETYDIPKVIEAYNRAKVVVNHATDVGQPFGTGYGFQCRHFEVGMTRTCLVSNHISGPEEYVNSGPKGWVSYSSEEELIENVKILLTTPEAARVRADWLYDDIMANHLPMKRAIQVTDFVRSL